MKRAVIVQNSTYIIIYYYTVIYELNLVMCDEIIYIASWIFIRPTWIFGRIIFHLNAKKLSIYQNKLSKFELYVYTHHYTLNVYIICPMNTKMVMVNTVDIICLRIKNSSYNKLKVKHV